MALTVGIDEVGYGPRLGPLVVAAACARGKLRTRHRIADSKKLFSQSRGVGTLEPAVLGFVPAATLADLLAKLDCRLPDKPWYGTALRLPSVEPARGLRAAYARFVDPAEFNASTRERNKSDLLFEMAADLITRIRAGHPGPIRFLVGKQGGRRFYLADLQRRVCPTVMIREERPERSSYALPGATIDFLRDAEDHHPLVALASMIGKYVRECAMKLFNDYWAAQRPGIRPTAGYGVDGMRFYRDIEPDLERLRIDREAVLRLR